MTDEVSDAFEIIQENRAPGLTKAGCSLDKRHIRSTFDEEYIQNDCTSNKSAIKKCFS